MLYGYYDPSIWSASNPSYRVMWCRAVLVFAIFVLATLAMAAVNEFDTFMNQYTVWLVFKLLVIVYLTLLTIVHIQLLMFGRPKN